MIKIISHYIAYIELFLRLNTYCILLYNLWYYDKILVKNIFELQDFIFSQYENELLIDFYNVY